MRHELVAVADASDWAAFHAIRRVELFEAKGRFGIYNDQHPDDYADFAHPLLLKVDGRAVGTVRIDLLGQGRAAIRLVAITATEQGRGLGTVMEALAAERARALGVSELVVNSAAEAAGFYEKTGWTRYDWDPAELVNIASACIQMRKLL
ncbi:MAG: GNAT family N-acetyltransferase [Pseudolabrys sp.]|uniref:GNAT family N-acetyltransferase n=1 Tax=Devosia sp. TaxID=1871048 RepID=UPI0024C75220|nr:GNAT family N-acetyltransferase [Devosia sp.]MCW5686563.1 GNAT family N-acetyltransferase [Pseudolabrys sp.]UYO00723.1 MAG: GNAT family N-acetyltransferase [Devosia sp.]